MSMTNLANYTLEHWKNSLKILKINNVRDFFLITLKSIITCYRELFSVWFLTLPIIAWMIWLNFRSHVPYFYGNTLITSPYQYISILACFWLAFVVLAARPSMNQKTVRDYLYTGYGLAVGFFLVEAFIARAYWIGLLWLFFALFYLDNPADTQNASDWREVLGSFFSAVGRALSNAFKLCLFTAPLIFIFGIPLIFILYFLPWSVGFLLWAPVVISLFTNIYIRERYSYFADYQ